MSNAKLPEQPSLEYLKKLAKDRLRDLRRTDPAAKLAAAQLTVARDHGFPSWRALKAEVDRRSSGIAARLFDACASGDVAAVGEILANDPALVNAADERRPHGGWSGLHTAAYAGQAAVVRLLLELGADPHARETGDNTTALHWAAARGDLETIRSLLDAGADVHGVGDVHELEVIGWATVFRAERDLSLAVLDVLRAHGARHHIFSAIAVGDPELIREVVARDPAAQRRRLSRFEHGRSPLHFAIERQRPDLVPLLIELGADIDAVDARGATALAFAMGRKDMDAARALIAAGAERPRALPPRQVRDEMAQLASATRKGVPMIGVPDIAASLDWYGSIGFAEVERYAENGLVNFGMVTFGRAELMFGIHARPNAENVRLWFYTTAVDRLYELLKARQLAAAQAELEGSPPSRDAIVFEEELYDPFYGGRQFSIRDPDGYTLIFYRDG